jgi:alpha-L-fucosidase 2
VSRPDNVFVVHLNSSAARSLNFTAWLVTPLTAVNNTATATTLVLNGKNSAEGVLPAAMTFQISSKLILTDGTSTASGNTLHVTGASSATIIISVASSFIDYKDGSSGNPAKRNSDYFNAVSSTDVNTLRKRHLQTYQSSFDRFSIDLGNNEKLSALPTDQRVALNMSTVDPGLISLFINYARSLSIGSSQPGSVQPSNLQGVWQVESTGAWQSKFTVNINLEMN